MNVALHRATRNDLVGGIASLPDRLPPAAVTVFTW